MPRNQAKTIDDQVTRWISHCETRGLAPATIINWRTYLRRLAVWADGTALDQLTLSDLDDFIADEYGHLSYSSKKAATLALRNFFQWASSRGVCDDVAAGLAFPRKPTRPRPTYYTPEQVSRILGEIRETGDRLIATLLARHGQRISAVVALRWGQLDFENGAIHYASVKRTRAMSLVLDRDTSRDLLAWRLLCRWTDPEDYVFPAKRGRQWHRFDDGFREVLREACKRCGVPYRGSHEFRRTLATTLLMNGVPLHAVSQGVLGHSSVQTTVESYAGPLDDSVSSALRDLPF